MKKKKIIFGAGNYGKIALDYYGSDNVAYFTDNDLKKVGTYLGEKEVIGVERLCDIAEHYDVVIATNAYAEIKTQLSSIGVERVECFFPSLPSVKERILDCCDIASKKVYIVGINEVIAEMVNLLNGFGVDNESIVFVDENTSEWIGKEYLEKRVISLSQIEYGSDMVFFVAHSVKAFAIQVMLQNSFPNAEIINPFIPRMYYETKNLIHNPYGDTQIEKTEKEWNLANAKNSAIEGVYYYAEALQKYQPIFEHIEIETINRCNGMCDFCPVSGKNEKRKRTVMTEELFKKIIAQLEEISYSGRLALFSNNEPFLDERIVDFNHYARKRLPNARLHLFTNGSLLTLEKFIRIVDDLDELIIDNYNQELALNETSQIIEEYCNLHPDLKKKVTIVLRKPHEILTSRGGDAPNRQEKVSYPEARCVLPFKQMIIRPDGKVSLCCNDPYGRMTLGDVNTETLMDIWNGDEFKLIRNRLMNGRKNLEHCVQCDTFIQY